MPVIPIGHADTARGKVKHANSRIHVPSIVCKCCPEFSCLGTNNSLDRLAETVCTSRPFSLQMSGEAAQEKNIVGDQAVMTSDLGIEETALSEYTLHGGFESDLATLLQEEIESD